MARTTKATAITTITTTTDGLPKSDANVTNCFSHEIPGPQGFPADYSWAFATPASPDQKARLQDVVKNRMAVYTRADSQ